MIQIFGTRKCRDTQKAERFFKERGIKYHLLDIAEKAPSPGELEAIARAVGKDNLIDKEGKLYEKLGLKFQVYDPIDKLLDEPLLLKTPVVRSGKSAVIGLAEARWKEMAALEKP